MKSRSTTGRSTKRPSTLNDIDYFIFKRIEKNRTNTNLFSFAAVQTYNYFQISRHLVLLLQYEVLVLEGSVILVKSTKV
jgi:hypothetical protein